MVTKCENHFCFADLTVVANVVYDVKVMSSDSGHLVMEDEEHIKWFVRTYLETHPKLSAAQIDDQMVTKWTIGLYKAMFVRNNTMISVNRCWYLMILLLYFI